MARREPRQPARVARVREHEVARPESLGGKTFGPESPEAKQKYALGDVVNTFIRTGRGETIIVTHDTNTPRPYSRKILLQGTKGVVQKYPTPPRIYIEGTSPNDEWEMLQKHADQYEHPIWRTLEDQSKGAGHGGMDYIEDFRLVQCLRAGTPTDMDVYDGAAWSSVSELSERSIAGRSQPDRVSRLHPRRLASEAAARDCHGLTGRLEAGGSWRLSICRARL